MDESQFWLIIDNAWAETPGLLAHRDAALKTITSPETKDELGLCIPQEAEFISVIEKQLEKLTAAQLLRFDRILERKLFDIDREEIHEYTDGSDDGFLYCRGYIVAIGKSYYDAISVNPPLAVCDCECEPITHASAHIYGRKFGKMPRSEICRETQSNQACW